ncbi:sucrose-phosphate phosphatase [Aerosakkonema funiforme]|uniref:sucrose-phosphate phosphatase n=1 Tax=Aerosakkonema funiforme TaxID=1246630 RepID=UPI0035B83E70
MKFLFVTDLDNTLVGDDEALEKLNQLLSQHRQEHGTKIVYATGRSLALYRQLLTENQLLEPDALIAAVGTEIYYSDREDEPDPVWSAQLSVGWNRDVVVATGANFADIVPQPTSEQRPFKVSYFVTERAAEEVIPRLESLLKERGVDAQSIYSGSKDLDILPRNSNKGLAVQFLRQQWGIEATRTVVCGDSGNDIALFSVGEPRGIIVGNAQPELRQWLKANPAEYRYLAKADCAGGILEGLYHFGFLS